MVVTRAPGRLDVMGGIADYSGSLVLQRTIAEATHVELQRIEERVIDIVSGTRAFSFSVSSLIHDGEPIAYDEARGMFRNAETHWASYVIGVFVVLMRERGVMFSDGAKIRISSEVPEGKGVASSAALEVAVMQAVATAFEISILPQDLALLCQKVENRVAGAPCGLMDQMTSVCGEPDALLALLCQPAELLPSVPVPEGISFWGLDSGERHAVSGSDYTSVRAAAFMGSRMIGLKKNEYLANIKPSEFTRTLASSLPEEMSGAEFLTRFSGTYDSVTTVDPTRIYKVRCATAHPVFENHRVHEFRRLLIAPQREGTLSELGRLMYESHHSYSECGLGSPGTDGIVRLVQEAGPEGGLFGARITGGGSGGTVAILGRSDAGKVIAEIAEKYRNGTGYSPYVFAGSSPGASHSGSRSIQI
jgi:L-arabinokinase